MRERLRKAEDALAAAEGGLLVALLAIMVTLAFAQVLLRHFGLGLLWGETALKHLVLWTGFLGAALAARSEKHFAWEASHVAAPARLKPWLRLAANLSGAAITALLLQASWIYFLDDRASGAELMKVAGVIVPSWVATAGIPGGFALVLGHLLFKSADAALEARGR
ncbi:MAG: TRAP transporter small permease subunit [Elusimicrobia bacterium]|nr:TRAP transporter small permease subunit [Elusimicrobiota bacterium]